MSSQAISITRHRGVASSLRRKLLTLGAIALVTALCGPAAHAAYSGTVVRSVCVNGAGIAKKGDASFWGQGANICASKVTDTTSNATFHWTRVSIPVERASAGTVSARLSASGGASGNGQVCMKLTTYNKDGNFVDQKNTDCTVNPNGLEVLDSTSMNVEKDGVVLMDIAAQNNGEARVASITYVASGS